MLLVMLFNTPLFWQRKSCISWLLWPLSLVYRFISFLLFYIANPVNLPVPIICIGSNLVGGAGKTPLAIAIAKYLKENNFKIVFACRNYRGRIKDTTLVNEHHRSPDIVDEALLMSKIAPTIVASTRLEAVRAAASMANVDLVISDDGLQNNSFVKDLTILVDDTEISSVNNFIFPAGPCRESFDSAIARSDIVCVLNSVNNTKYSSYNLPILNASKTYVFFGEKEKKYIAFTGIAYPKKFFNSLRNQGFAVDEEFNFPDHQSLSDQEIEKILVLAQKKGASVITTEKDFIKIPEKYHQHIQVLKLNLSLENGNIILQFLKNTNKAEKI